MSPGALGATLDGLPHRAPFRFLTAVRRLEPGVHGEAEWAVSGEEDFFRGHFPGDPVVPGVLLGEALAQLAGLVMLASGAAGGAGAARAGRLARIDLKFPSAVRPPARVVLRAAHLRSMDGLGLFEVDAAFEGGLVASGQVVIAAPGAGA
ncbi:MAG: FabA/FabZ family ACP-dehydratase [Phycisphaerales bacterium]